MTNPIRHSHRQSTWLEYAPFFKTALEAYPNAIHIEPVAKTIATFASGMRAAREAKNMYSYPFFGKEHEAMWRQHAAELIFSMQGNEVVIGPKASVLKKASSLVGVKTDGCIVDMSDPNNLDMLCKLLSKKAFSPVPIFYVTLRNQMDADYLEQHYNVALTPHPTDKTKWQII